MSYLDTVSRSCWWGLIHQLLKFSYKNIFLRALGNVYRFFSADMIPASSISFKINANFLLPLCVAKMKKMIPRTAKTQDFVRDRLDPTKEYTYITLRTDSAPCCLTLRRLTKPLPALSAVQYTVLPIEEEGLN